MMLLSPRSQWSVRRRSGILSLILAAMLLLSLLASAQRGTPTAQAQTWNLVWQDNMDRFEAGNWTYETGGGGWGNNERQYYTNGQNASYSGGILTIEARRGSGGYSCWYGTCEWTSTRMFTKGKRQFQYGRIEARMALPLGAGLWPAFWMLGSNIDSVGWPVSGEIDIMEHVNTEANTHGYIHWDAGGHAQYGSASFAHSPGGWHTYMVEWTPSYIRWFVDGQQFVEANIANGVNSTEEFHRPFFIILNLAVGGNWPGMPNTSTPSPARLQVDYVRVYQQGTTPPPPPPPTQPPTGGTISTSTWYSIQNVGNNLCLDGENWGTGNGTRILQWHCGATQANQHWLFVPTDGGYYRIMYRHGTPQDKALEIGGGAGATGNGAKTQIWQYVGGGNQQWRPESMGAGIWRLRARHSNRCLDVPSASATAGLQLQQWDCNSSNAQNFRLIPR